MSADFTDSTQLQIHALRKALEQASCQLAAALQSAGRAQSDLQMERRRLGQIIAALNQSTARADELAAENERLYFQIENLTGEKESLAREMAGLLETVRAAAPDGEILKNHSMAA